MNKTPFWKCWDPRSGYPGSATLLVVTWALCYGFNQPLIALLLIGYVIGRYSEYRKGEGK